MWKKYSPDVSLLAVSAERTYTVHYKVFYVLTNLLTYVSVDGVELAASKTLGVSLVSISSLPLFYFSFSPNSKTLLRKLKSSSVAKQGKTSIDPWLSHRATHTPDLTGFALNHCPLKMSGRGHSRGLPKIFRAPIGLYRARITRSSLR